MARRQAIDIAMDALSRPEIACLLSAGPLPDGMKTVLKIVADGEWRDASTEHVYRRHEPETIRAAGAAFLGAVLFERTAEPYRVLGLTPGAAAEDVRENKRLLLKWLHPDRNPRPAERGYLACVLDAAERIESQGGRAAPPISPSRPSRRARRMREVPPRIIVPLRVKTSKKPAPPGPKQALAEALWNLAHKARLAVCTIFVLLGGLVAWRYLMHEPIGASITRYSKYAMGLMTW